ncbi:MAG: hypothetical protein LAT67_00355 [Balneolales bacterium]|nr:hypothetical protein [Balneolales bacterium]
MKVLKFFSVFILVAGLILGSVIYLNWTAFKLVFTDPETFSEGSEWIEKTYSLAGLVEYMDENHQHVSVVSLNLDMPEDNLLFQEHTPRVMGAISNIFLLMEMERQIDAGILDANLTIEISDIDAYLMPGWYENQHRNAIRSVAGRNSSIPLSDLPRLLTESYSQPASDFAFFLLGPENVNELIYTAGNGLIEPWFPASGIQATINMREENTDRRDKVTALLEMTTEERSGLFNEMATRYATDQEYRQQVQNRAEHIRNRPFRDERAIHGLWSKTDPKAFAMAVTPVFTREFISEEASNRIISFMKWAGEDPVVRQHTTEYGALFGSRLSYITGLDFGTSAYTNHSFVQVVFFDDLPVSFFLHMSSNHMNQDLQRRLIYDPEMRRLTDNASRQELHSSPSPESAGID